MNSDTGCLEAQFEQDKPGPYISEHYIFHFRPESLAKKEIFLIAKIQEQSFQKICRTLCTDYSEKIHYYLADSPLEIGRVFWTEGVPCNGCALFWKNTIYAVYSEDIKCIGSHEDTHVIACQIGSPQSDFLVEGLAMAMDGLWWEFPNEAWASYYKEKYPYISLMSLLDNEEFAAHGSPIAYPIAGAFSRYLIDVYGIELYLRLYQYDGSEYENAFHSIFSAPLAKIENAFWLELRKVPYDADLLEQKLHAELFRTTKGT